MISRGQAIAIGSPAAVILPLLLVEYLARRILGAPTGRKP